MSNVNDFKVVKKLGEGSFGAAYLVKRKTDGKLFCRKDIICPPDGRLKDLEKEVKILQSMQHPNIVAYNCHEYNESTRTLFLYMEYCAGGDLANCIEMHNRNNTHEVEARVWVILVQLLGALHLCHYGNYAPPAFENVDDSTASPRLGKRLRVVHRDIKPENILLTASKNAKLGDFGLSKIIEKCDVGRTFCGTLGFMAPELLEFETQTPSTDIWALGCTIFNLCALRSPFPDGNMNPRGQNRRKLPPFYSQSLCAIVDRCLLIHKDRPSTLELLETMTLSWVRLALDLDIRLKVVLAEQQRQENEVASQYRNEKLQLVSKLEQKELEIKTLQDKIKRFDRKSKNQIQNRVKGLVENMGKERIDFSLETTSEKATEASDVKLHEEWMEYAKKKYAFRASDLTITDVKIAFQLTWDVLEKDLEKHKRSLGFLDGKCHSHCSLAIFVKLFGEEQSKILLFPTEVKPKTQITRLPNEIGEIIAPTKLVVYQRRN